MDWGRWVKPRAAVTCSGLPEPRLSQYNLIPTVQYLRCQSMSHRSSIKALRSYLRGPVSLWCCHGRCFTKSKLLMTDSTSFWSFSVSTSTWYSVQLTCDCKDGIVRAIGYTYNILMPGGSCWLTAAVKKCGETHLVQTISISSASLVTPIGRGTASDIRGWGLKPSE